MNAAGFAPAIQPILERIVATFVPETPAYLVGGAVRDLLCSRPSHDLDFTFPKHAIQIGRRLANALNAAFYPLDIERDAGRLILFDASIGRLVIDVSRFRGADLESDLRDRDFTINAMALDLRRPEVLIDPLGGARDLHNKVLRPCSPHALEDDPVRVLRAVRLSLEFGLHLSNETSQLLRQAAPGLATVSIERLRDEIFRMLNGPSPASAIRILDRLGALPGVFPELPALKGIEQPSPHTLDAWEHSLATVQQLGNLMEVLGKGYDPETAANWAYGLVSLRLGRFRQPLAQYLSTQLNPDRSLSSLILLAALFHDIAKPQTFQTDADGKTHFYQHERIGEQICRARGSALRLSNPEIERLASIVGCHMRPILLAQSAELPSRRAIYRFFRAAGDSGVAVCLLALADTLATYGTQLPQAIWVHQVDVARALLEAWWERPEEIVLPPSLLNGNDLIEQFKLTPGPQIGQLLELIREAQAAGEIHNRAQALALAQFKVDQG